MAWRCGILAVIFGLGLCRAAFADEPASVKGGSSPASQEATLSQLIEDLGSPVWRTRETATLSLMQRGPKIYDTMRAAYRQASQHEVRRRIKRVVAEVYVSQLLGPAPAFLGISHTPSDLTWQTDARVPAGGSALQINDVFPWTAADRAGVRRGDLVVSLNGKRATVDHPAGRFPAWIKAQRVGTLCRLGVLRGGSGRVLRRGSPRGFDPRGFSKLKMRVLYHADDPRIADGFAGFMIEKIGRADSRLRLKKGDLLVALDGQAISADGAVEAFSKWTQGERHGQPPAQEGPPQVLPGNAKNPPSGENVPSAQVLREVRWLELSATLGRRPTFLPGGRASPRGTQNSVLDDADAAFEAWWRAEFEGGRSSAGQLGDEEGW